MNCINCKKEIPDASVVCPYCNSKVEPSISAAPTFDVPEQNNTPIINSMEGFSVNNSPMQVAPNAEASVEAPVIASSPLPVLPTEPQLPTDQNNLMVDTSVQPVVTPEMANNEMPTMVPENGGGVIKASTAPAPTAPDIPMPTATVGVTVPTEVKKKINGKKIAIISVIITVIVAIILGGVYYYVEYLTANKRVNKVMDAVFEAPLFSTLNNVNNSKMELASGEYEVNVNLDYTDTKLTADIYGKYGIDAKGKVADFTFNAKNVNLQNNELIAEKKPLSIEVFSNNDRVYLLLQNFYDKYIYIQDDSFASIYDNIEQNDINYAYILDALKESLKDGLSEADKTQSVKSVTFNGKTEKLNVVTIDFSANNKTKIISAYIDSLVSNQQFLKELNKLTGLDVDTLKSKLNEAKTAEFDDSTTKFELYSEVYGFNFVGLKIYDDKSSVEVSLEDDKYNIQYFENGAKLLKLTIGETVEKAAKTVTRTGVINLEVFANDTAYKSDITYKIVSEVNPKIEKPDTKNSINYEDITVAEEETIMKNVYDFGLFGQVVKEYQESRVALEEETGKTTTITDKCSQAFACMPYDGGPSECSYCADENCETVQKIWCAESTEDID